MKPRIVITLGDPAGIGPEIVAMAMRDHRVLRSCEPIIVGDPAAFLFHHKALPKVEMMPVPGLTGEFVLGRASRAAGLSAVESLKTAAALMRTGQARALVTAPVSKEVFKLAGVGAPGHTEWLAEQFQSGPVGMLMAAGEMRALLMTRHLPIAKVPAALTAQVIKDSARLAFVFSRKILRIPRPRLAACGLNPHAGDNGILGKEEIRIFRPTIAELRKSGIPIEGPYSSDAVFRDAARGIYDVVLAAYHDQGMIPLKVHAPEKLVNITLGLPFIRTSPGHGTAYDISGKGIADPRPMIEAILLAARYAA
jgi:4-hydroxythreonine-4-phosphate dehydrogenase